MGVVAGAGTQSGVIATIAGNTTLNTNTYGQPVTVYCVNNATAGTVTIGGPGGVTAAYVPLSSQLHALRIPVGGTWQFSQTPGAMAVVAD